MVGGGGGEGGWERQGERETWRRDGGERVRKVVLCTGEEKDGDRCCLLWVDDECVYSTRGELEMATHTQTHTDTQTQTHAHTHTRTHM